MFASSETSTRGCLGLLDGSRRRAPRGGTASGAHPRQATAAPRHEVAAAALDSETGEVLPTTVAYASAIERIAAIPGGGPETARAVIGEVGLDMAVFGAAQRLCSWAKTSPRSVQSGRKSKGAPAGKGNPYLKAVLGQMATGAAKPDTFLGERYRRLIKRMPKKKALAAIERSILVVIFQLLSDPSATFTDFGSDFYTKRIDKRRRRRSASSSPSATCRRGPRSGTQLSIGCSRSSRLTGAASPSPPTAPSSS